MCIRNKNGRNAHKNVKDNVIGNVEYNFHFMYFYVVWILYSEQA